MTLCFIRHGQTRANQEKLYCGVTDLPLSQQGIQELLALKQQIQYPNAQIHIISGLLRTKQTMDILYNHPNSFTNSNLRELNFGDFEMFSYDQLKGSAAYQEWISNIYYQSPINGESKPDFTQRVITGFHEVQTICLEKSLETAIIITHGGVIATIMEYLCPKQKNFYEWQPKCGRGYSLQFQDSKITEIINI